MAEAPESTALLLEVSLDWMRMFLNYITGNDKGELLFPAAAGVSMTARI
jgi:hypothetical protein